MGIRDRIFSSPVLAVCYLNACFCISFLVGRNIGSYLNNKYDSYRFGRVPFSEEVYKDNREATKKKIAKATE